MKAFDSSIDLQGLQPSFKRVEKDKFKNIKKNKRKVIKKKKNCIKINKIRIIIKRKK